MVESGAEPFLSTSAAPAGVSIIAILASSACFGTVGPNICQKGFEQQMAGLATFVYMNESKIHVDPFWMGQAPIYSCLIRGIWYHNQAAIDQIW